MRTTTDEMIDDSRESLKAVTQKMMETNKELTVGDAWGVDDINDDFKDRFRQAADLVQKAYALIKG